MLKDWLAKYCQETSRYPFMPGVEWKQTSYEGKVELVQLLKGVNTLLCFWDVSKDPDATAQKRLVDAAVEAGVKRYAPSEWSM